MFPLFLRSITNDICSVSHLLFLDSNEIEWRANGEGYEKCYRLSSKSEIKSHQVLLRLNGLRYAIHSNVLGLLLGYERAIFPLDIFIHIVLLCKMFTVVLMYVHIFRSSLHRKNNIILVEKHLFVQTAHLKLIFDLAGVGLRVQSADVVVDGSEFTHWDSRVPTQTCFQNGIMHKHILLLQRERHRYQHLQKTLWCTRSKTC